MLGVREPQSAEASRQLIDAALESARVLGASHASFRLHEIRTGQLLLRDARPHGTSDTSRAGIAVRARVGGVWGFASTTELTAQAAARTAAEAVTVAERCSALGRNAHDPVDEPVHRDAEWVSRHRFDPFDVPEADRFALLADWSGRLLATQAVDHVLAKFVAVRENKLYADLAGTLTTQQVIRVHPQLVVIGGGESLRTQGPPTARGWEYLSGDGWDWDGEIARLPELLAEKARARPVEPGEYDLVIDPSNLWLTIHETVGHATELDRALGHEASYAGTTFVTPDAIGTLRYGSPLMTITADRRTPHGLATIGFDDEGVAAQRWRLVENGVLRGFQLDRNTAGVIGAERSNGCAFAESAEHVPLQRMPNVSLEPAPDGPDTAGLIAGVSDGIYLVGAASWSIDMCRDNFQFTAQRAYRIRGGRLGDPLSGVAYQGRTTDFWAGLGALGGQRSYQMFGADLCGKGLPVQAAPTSHGSPAAVFERVRVLNTAEGTS